MKYPDICGYSLGMARILLEKEGYCIKTINILKPPKDETNEVDDTYRVIKVMPLEGTSIELMVCKPLK